MEINDMGSVEMFEELAERFKSFGRLFEQYSTPESIEELFKIRASGNSEAFEKIVADIKLPVFGACVIVQEIIDTAMAVGIDVEVCRLKDNLTFLQLLEAIRIIRQHQIVTFGTIPVLMIGNIAPGPLLDELTAAGLVTCSIEREWVSGKSLGFPTKICF